MTECQFKPAQLLVQVGFAFQQNKECRMHIVLGQVIIIIIHVCCVLSTDG